MRNLKHISPYILMLAMLNQNQGGIRKLRWSSGGRGKQGGVRIIYYNRLENGEIWLLTLYSKKELNQLSKKTLKLLVEKLNDSFND